MKKPSEKATWLRDKLIGDTYKIRLLVNKHMPSKGSKEYECQQLTVLNRLSDLEHAINGITGEDFAEEE